MQIKVYWSIEVSTGWLPTDSDRTTGETCGTIRREIASHRKPGVLAQEICDAVTQEAERVISLAHEHDPEVLTKPTVPAVDVPTSVEALDAALTQPGEPTIKEILEGVAVAGS